MCLHHLQKKVCVAHGDRLCRVVTPVVYFLVLTSVIVHGKLSLLNVKSLASCSCNPGITIPVAKSFSGVRRMTLTRSAGATFASAGPLNSAVTRLPQAPTDLPTDQGFLDDHDIRGAPQSTTAENEINSKTGSPDFIARTASASPVLGAPPPAVVKDCRSSENPKSDGLIRFQSTVVIEGETRLPGDLNGNEEPRLTKRAREIHGNLPT